MIIQGYDHSKRVFFTPETWVKCRACGRVNLVRADAEVDTLDDYEVAASIELAIINLGWKKMICPDCNEL